MKEKNTTAREPLIHLSKRSSISPWGAAGIRVAAFLLALLCCGLVALLLIDKLKQNPGDILKFYRCFIDGSFFSSAVFWKFLKNTAILLCISLAVTPAFRMRFWNIGAEGQTLMGVLAAIGVAYHSGGSLPEWALLILMFAAALLFGMLWAIIPAVFKAIWNTNETLFTLMMNYVAKFIVSYCLIKWVPSGSSSLGKLPYGKLPTIGNDYLLIILVALVLAVGMFVYLKYSKHGYEISVVGESERTAKYIGINVRRVIIRTMILSGLLCGLAGYLIAAGLDQTVTTESVGGQGFTAIMVSWLGKFNPLFMSLTSSVIVFLQLGASEISTVFDVRGAMPDIIVGIILFFIIGCEFFINYKVHFRRREGKAKTPVAATGTADTVNKADATNAVDTTDITETTDTPDAADTTDATDKTDTKDTTDTAKEETK